MEHIRIFYYIFTLMAGAGAIFYSHLMERSHSYSFLRHITLFIAFNNLLNLVNLTSEYACANLIGFSFLYRYTLYPSILGPIARLTKIGIVYALVGTVQGFRGSRLTRRFNRLFAAGTIILALGYAAQGILIQRGIFFRRLLWTNNLIYLLAVLASLALLARLLFYAGAVDDKKRAKAIRTFAIFYLAGYSLFILSFPLPTSVQFILNAPTILLFNIFPFFWFKRFFLKGYQAVSRVAEDGVAMETICGKFSLTPREQELAGLILKGKSNRDIEKALFISFHTVKNHITNLYLKLGVRNRWQLISLFHEKQQRQREALEMISVAEREMRPNGIRPS